LLNIEITFSTSTEDALKKIRSYEYSVIISDMGRPPDSRAGYTLLEEIQKMKINKPFIIYAGSNLPEHKAEALRRGAYGSTNNPQELFDLVKSSLVDRE
jgi:DNA-binding NtrC family response regulator